VLGRSLPIQWVYFLQTNVCCTVHISISSYIWHFTHNLIVPRVLLHFNRRNYIFSLCLIKFFYLYWFLSRSKVWIISTFSNSSIEFFHICFNWSGSTTTFLFSYLRKFTWTICLLSFMICIAVLTSSFFFLFCDVALKLFAFHFVGQCHIAFWPSVCFIYSILVFSLIKISFNLYHIWFWPIFTSICFYITNRPSQFLMSAQPIGQQTYSTVVFNAFAFRMNNWENIYFYIPWILKLFQNGVAMQMCFAVLKFSSKLNTELIVNFLFLSTLYLDDVIDSFIEKLLI